MEAPTAKRGVYPLHGFKLGLYRLPIVLEDPNEIKSVHDGLKKAFEMDMYADRIYATYRWKEQNMDDPDEKGYEEVDLSVTVEIVTGEIVYTVAFFPNNFLATSTAAFSESLFPTLLTTATFSSFK